MASRFKYSSLNKKKNRFWGRKREPETNIGASDIEKLLASEREIAQDLIHELKKFHNRIDASAKALVSATEDYGYQSQSVRNKALSIKALAELTNRRMELYEYQLSPESHEAMASQGVSIYKEIEKLYKCINSGDSDEKKDFKLEGESWCRFKTKRIVSVGLFIVLENAWKYTHPDKPIIIEFREKTSTLEVDIMNWGPIVTEAESQKILDRGFRSEEAKKNGGIKGKGLGLDIAKRIFSSCGVEFEIDTSNRSEIRYYENFQYTPFKVKLKFSPMVPSYS